MFSIDIVKKLFSPHFFSWRNHLFIAEKKGCKKKTLRQEKKLAL